MRLIAENERWTIDYTLGPVSLCYVNVKNNFNNDMSTLTDTQLNFSFMCLFNSFCFFVKIFTNVHFRVFQKVL